MRNMYIVSVNVFPTFTYYVVESRRAAYSNAERESMPH